MPLVAIAVAAAACGGSPLDSIGWRSSNWIGEPEVSTTTTTEPARTEVVAMSDLLWSNDGIVTENLDNTEDLIAEIFARRQGDRFIQASRAEIAIALPGVSFPSRAPAGAEWVSSQLIIENTGRLSEEPAAAFGIWSAEPYTRSRSVAQMAVLRVSIDPVNATEVELPDTEISCARFADRTTQQCSMLTSSERVLWRLSANDGLTIIWFDAPYRYELYGRAFVPASVLEKVASEVMPLADLVTSGS